MAELAPPDKSYPVYVPTADELKARNRIFDEFTQGRLVVNREYEQFNGRNLYEAIDDWTKRWNGYISAPSPLLDADQSRIFLNFTRNQVLSYLSKVALNQPESRIKAVNKKTGMLDMKFSKVLEDLNKYSLIEENGPARFLEAALECTTKGTVVLYEGYARNVQKMKIPDGFDMMTGKGKFREENRVVFDNCFQKIVPIEDFYIANPYQPDVQKQPYVLWRQITTHEEAEAEFGHYANWKYVQPGSYSLASDPTTFYRNSINTDLARTQVEVLRYYNRSQNRHVVMISGVIIYDGPIPFKDGLYPFAKGIFEPYATDFFWGAGFPQKIMGDQDLINTFWNMMADKTFGSLLPFGLSSDLDDWIEDDSLKVNKIRKVGDINKWKFETLPGVSAGEQNMLQMAMNFARENSGISGGGAAMTARGGKLNVRQVLLQQQEAMQRIGFSMVLLEDLDRDRTILRTNHILQFYSIPKMEKITGKSGKELNELVFRDVRLSDVKLSDGTKGTRVIKLVSKPTTTDARQKIADGLSVTEAMGEELGTPTEALAVSVDTFYDYNLSVQVIRNSSYEKNAALDQASRMEFANWRIPLASSPAPGVPPAAPADVSKIVDWVEESFDVDPEEFKMEQQAQPQQPQPLQPGAGMPPGAPSVPPGPLSQTKPSSMPDLSSMMQ